MTLRRALVELSVVEQRYQAVLQVSSGANVTEVARTTTKPIARFKVRKPQH